MKRLVACLAHLLPWATLQVRSGGCKRWHWIERKARGIVGWLGGRYVWEMSMVRVTTRATR